ncbi:adenosine kinase [Elysia marginata]|uniref:Adenosine kinase n=1 Tax=Elysia marginata TaxID=1093978 RepID=A0AAV4HH70_9GAST|nr:adenosine kinase [Elysia marginata]
MVRIAKHAAENNKVVCMNMSAPFLCTFFKEPMLQMLPYVDYWFGNETEADEFAKVNEFGVNGQVKEYPVVTIKSEDIVDSNGAGDSFVGGFLSQLVQGKPLEECIRCGHHTANIVLQRTGCSLPEKPTFV